MDSPSNKIVVWPNGINPLAFSLELTSQPNRTKLTHTFGQILRKLFKPCRVFIYAADNGRRIEPDRNTELSSVKIRNLLQPVESLEIYSLCDIDGAMESLDNQAVTTISLGNGTSRMIWPIRGRGGICNLLVIEYTQPLNTNQVDIASMVRLFENLINIFDQAESDSLTGLLNRTAFDKSMQDLLVKEIYVKNQKVAQKKKRVFAMLDIDHFKQVNDKYGHLYGDEVLLHFSRLLTESFRRHDWLFRFGGEEFSVVLEVTEPPQAEFILERFRKSVESFDFPIVGKVTVSIGLTQVNPGEAIPHIVDKADMALYHAKKTGRNRVIVYENVFDNETTQRLLNQESDITLF